MALYAFKIFSSIIHVNIVQNIGDAANLLI